MVWKQMANRAVVARRLHSISSSETWLFAAQVGILRVSGENLLRLYKARARNRHIRLVWLANRDRSLYCGPEAKAVDLLA
jgi:hypothetical protein